MNIYNLKNVIKLVPSIRDITHGNEFIFTQKIKSILPSTNFELLGEQLIVGKDNTIGKCDLWLANIPNNFLLSLELKVGEITDSKKRKFLNTQVCKYTDFMKFYYPENNVCGMGIYKCITKPSNLGINIRFIDYRYIDQEINQEIEIFKNKIKKECLN